jgi:hypothetical protein
MPDRLLPHGFLKKLSGNPTPAPPKNWGGEKIYEDFDAVSRRQNPQSPIFAPFLWKGVGGWQFASILENAILATGLPGQGQTRA